MRTDSARLRNRAGTWRWAVWFVGGIVGVPLLMGLLVVGFVAGWMLFHQERPYAIDFSSYATADEIGVSVLAGSASRSWWIRDQESLAAVRGLVGELREGWRKPFGTPGGIARLVFYREGNFLGDLRIAGVSSSGPGYVLRVSGRPTADEREISEDQLERLLKSVGLTRADIALG